MTLEDVRRAEAALRPHLPPTPLRSSMAAGPRGLLKLECWQPTGSFKVRGATAFLASLSDGERGRGIVTASAGNHALGVAFAVEAVGRGCAATVFVPETAPRAKVDKLRTFPVRVVLEGPSYDEAYEAAVAHAERTGGLYLHAFDDVRTAAGQGTVALEILAARPKVDTIVVPVGGGGLISGIATVTKALAPEVRIVAVQPEASPALRESLKEGRALLTYPFTPTIADGLAGGIGELVFAHRDLVDELVTVSEEEIRDAIRALLVEDHVVAEASGAVGVAALRAGKIPGAGLVATIVTGANIDPGILTSVLAA
jgi:threonine dehydratase